MNDHISWLLELSIKSGQLDNLKALMNEMVQATYANEPGTLNYEWFINEEESSCHLYERYTDSDAVMIHLGTFGEMFAERFLAAMEPTRLMVYGSPSDAVIQALSGFGAVFHPPMAGFAR